MHPTVDTRWWTLEDPEGTLLADTVVEAAHAVEFALAERSQQILNMAALYGYGAADSNGYAEVIPPEERCGVNIVANAVDALIAEVTQSETAPMFTTVGGDYLEQTRAKRLTSYCEAKFDEFDVPALMRRAIRDAILFGLGICRAHEEDGVVQYERIHPLNFLIDDRLCVDTVPRVAYIRRVIDRRLLMAMFPKRAEEIEKAPPPEDDYWYALESDADVVEVIEGWHLASKRGEKDGQHVLAVRDCEPLVDDVYDRSEFPLVFLRALDPIQGFWGLSLADRVAGTQLEYNKQMQRRQEAHHLISVPRVFVQKGSALKSHFTNDVGIVIEHSGSPPQVHVPPAVSPDQTQFTDYLEDHVFQGMGVDRHAAQSQKPAGLNSGVAIRIHRDMQSRRFINLERNVEQAYCGLAMETVRLERALSAKNSSRTLPYEFYGKKREAPWSDFDVDDQRLRVKTLAASALPKSASGRLQILQEMVEAGVLTQEDFWRYADLPDFEGARDELVASSELIRERVDLMLSEGEYTGPEPYMDLKSATHIAGLRLQKAQLAGAPEDRCELVRRFITAVGDLRKHMAEQAAAEQAAAMPPPPLGGPAGPIGTASPPIGPGGPPASPLPPGPPGPGPMPPMPPGPTGPTGPPMGPM